MRRTPSVRHLLGSAAALLIAGCGGDGSTEVEQPVATTIEINQASVDLEFLGQVQPLTANVRDQFGQPIVAAVQWSSDNPSVASVSDAGAVTAVANGTTNITAAITGASASIVATVEQAPWSVTALSGGGQEAIRDSTLADPIVVRAVDRGGRGVEGVTVTFEPANGGQVSDTTVLTDVDGEAQTSWTLGPELGPQSLKADISVAFINLSAQAWAETPTPDLVLGDTIIFTRPDPTSLETVDVSATVRNVGNGATGGGFRVQLLRAGVEVGFVDIGALDRDEEQPVQMTVGPFVGGFEEMRLVGDSDDAIAELFETNNDLSQGLEVVTQVELSTTENLTLTVQADEVVFYRLTVPPGTPSPLKLQTTGSTGDIDIYIDRDPRPRGFQEYDWCVSAGPDSNELCQFFDAEGVYQIALHAFLNPAQPEDVVGLSFDVSVGGSPVPYDIELEFEGTLTAEEQALFTDAAQKWSSIIIGDMPDMNMTLDPLQADLCWTGQPETNFAIDDLYIYVSVTDIDGIGNVLAQTTPCLVRPFTVIPFLARIQFDQADLDELMGDGRASETVVHEMGHAIGQNLFTWYLRDVLVNPTRLDSIPGLDTHFNGPRAIAAFDQIGGAGYSGGQKVPLENTAVPGSADSHWRESVFDNELMTPQIEQTVGSPLSLVTIEALADLGFQVDVTQAEPYVVPFPLLRSPLGRVEEGVIDLRDDVLADRIVIVGEKGGILQIFEMR